MAYKLVKLRDSIEYPVTLLSVDQDASTEFSDLVLQLPNLPGLLFSLPAGLTGNFVTSAQTFLFPLAAEDFATEHAGTMHVRLSTKLTTGGLYLYPCVYQIPRIAGYGTAGCGKFGYGVSRMAWSPPELPRIQILYVPFNSGILPGMTVSGGFAPQRVM